MLRIAEIHIDMADQTLPPRFEIISVQKPRKKLPGRRLVGAFFTVAQTVLEDAYASVAKTVLIRQENLEDRIAERRFAKRARSAGRLSRSIQPRQDEGAGFRSASRLKSS